MQTTSLTARVLACDNLGKAEDMLLSLSVWAKSGPPSFLRQDATSTFLDFFIGSSAVSAQDDDALPGFRGSNLQTGDRCLCIAASHWPLGFGTHGAQLLFKGARAAKLDFMRCQGQYGKLTQHLELHHFVLDFDCQVSLMR